MMFDRIELLHTYPFVNKIDYETQSMNQLQFYFILHSRSIIEIVSFSSIVLHTTYLYYYRGIGLALAERLLHDHENLELCLACRNVTKAEAAKATLLETHPNATVSLVQMDVSNVQSVINSAQHLRTM